MTSLEPLSHLQKILMQDFYRKPDATISVNKKERRKIWNDFVKNRDIKRISHLESEVPAFYSEMEKALSQERNIQSAVFSECVYAQSFADLFQLEVFKNYSENYRIDLSPQSGSLHGVKDLSVRYSYSDLSESRTLYQAGGAGGVDCAFQTAQTDQPIMIEMKEPYSKASEPDLPKYGEDGLIVTNETFAQKNPQFESMLKEQIDQSLNVFKVLGNNVATFSKTSIEKAVTDNYAGNKLAHVICTEDKNGKLAMLPSNHVSLWAKLEGEIRPSGRNPAVVWTPIKLLHFLSELDATIQEGLVRIPMVRLKTAKERGSRKVSRYKINAVFFVRASDIEIRESHGYFLIEAVRQLIPTITAKMNFKGLDVSNIRKFYEEHL